MRPKPQSPPPGTKADNIISNFMFMLLFMGADWKFLSYLDPNDPDLVGHPAAAPYIAFIFLPLTVLLIQAGLKRGQLFRWWQAWDEKGRPVDVEVLDPAPIAKP